MLTKKIVVDTKDSYIVYYYTFYYTFCLWFFVIIAICILDLRWRHSVSLSIIHLGDYIFNLLLHLIILFLKRVTSWALTKRHILDLSLWYLRWCWACSESFSFSIFPYFCNVQTIGRGQLDSDVCHSCSWLEVKGPEKVTSGVNFINILCATFM